MCRPLTVSCLRVGEYSTDISDHIHISRAHQIPCKDAGISACARDSPSAMNFQASPTECAGEVAGFGPNSKEGEAVCQKALEQYAEAVWKVNAEGTGKKSWFGKLVKGWGGAKGEKKVGEGKGGKSMLRRKESEV